MKKTSRAFFAVVSIAFVGATEVRASDLFGPTGYHNWSGIYLGGQIGGFWSDINGSFVNAPLATRHEWHTGSRRSLVTGHEADTVTARVSYVFGRNRYEPEPLK